jgi:hypothetical protein
MGECAFCSYTGKLSAEHIASRWMRDLFPGRKTASFKSDSVKEKQRFETDSMDWTAKVVCKACNEGWMSKIESDHAMWSLTPLITGEFNIPIDRERAQPISLFAFKTGVIMDHQQRLASGPFFSKRLRYAFRLHHTIPSNVNMWLCGYKNHRGNCQFKTGYTKSEFPSGNNFWMYICTCAIGHFVFQVVAVKQIGNLQFRPSTFESLAVPFWPAVPRDYVWPSLYALDGIEQFEAFADRWQTISIVGR